MNLSPSLVRQLVNAYGDALYILDSNIFLNNFSELLDAFRDIYPETHIAYSYKTNYTPTLCRLVHQRGGFAEVVSEMEYELAKRIDVPSANIYYNGPYKKHAFLQKALLEGANVNLDSLAEVRVAVNFALSHPDHYFSVGLRCNFAIGTDNISRFGLDCDGEEFDESLRLLAEAKNLVLAGIHCHFPNRQLDTFRARAEGMTALLQRLSLPQLRYVSFGGGYLGKISPALAEILDIAPSDYADYATVVATAMSKLFGKTSNVRLIIEPGSAVVADAMSIAARVVSVKTVRGRNVATIAASTYNVNPSAKGVRRPIEVISPQGSRTGGFRTHDLGATWDIVGYTCIEDDCLYSGFQGPIEEGDIVVLHNVGSYSVVFKPPFILPNIPVVDIAGGGESVVKRAETFDDVFATFELK